MDAEEAQDAQIVLGDPRRRVADEADAPGAQVGKAAERIDQRAVGLGVERVHGEVAPGRVLGDVVGEGDDRAAAVGGDVAAEGRDLERLVLGDHGDGAVRDAGRHRCRPAAAASAITGLGPRVGGDVDVGDRAAEQRVAHAAADEERAVPAAVSAAHDGPGRAARPASGPSRRVTGLHPVGDSVRSMRAVAPQM